MGDVHFIDMGEVGVLTASMFGLFYLIVWLILGILFRDRPGPAKHAVAAYPKDPVEDGGVGTDPAGQPNTGAGARGP